MILKCYDYGCLEKGYLRCHAVDQITNTIHHSWSHELKLTPPTISQNAIKEAEQILKRFKDFIILYRHINQLMCFIFYFFTLLMKESYNIIYNMTTSS